MLDSHIHPCSLNRSGARVRAADISDQALLVFFTVLAELGTLKPPCLHLYAFLLASQWDALELENKEMGRFVRNFQARSLIRMVDLAKSKFVFLASWLAHRT